MDAEDGQHGDDAVLRELAAAYGVDAEYWDWEGSRQPVGASTLRAVLGAFGVDASTPQSCRAVLDEHRRVTASRVLPPCVVLRAGRTRTIVPNGVDPEGLLRAWVDLEDGSIRELATESGIAESGAVELPGDLPTGYHRLLICSAAATGGRHHDTALIVTPDRLALPDGFAGPGWGLAAQLYSVRSHRSWGLGDLGDLAELATWAGAKHGADFVLVNPLHAAEVVAPINPSPYLPTTRRFANPIYLRVEDVAGYAALPADARAAVDQLGAQRRSAQETEDLLDRDATWAAKLAALQILFDATRGRGRHAARDEDFATYTAREGAALRRFATWCALCEVHGRDWHTWPAHLHDPASAQVAQSATDLAARVEFYEWLQWQLDMQLARAQEQARAAGMRIGVIHDVAVGVSADGAESWAWQDVLAHHVTVGAPPDAYSQVGQNWEQPPWRPDRLAELAYAPLRDLFATMLRHGGGLRVDHVIGLFRLWWIPAGRPAAEGAYVHYDHEALLGILALEAERAGAVIIGEDLGNVDPRARGYLRELGLLGTSILWFEAEWGSGVPLAPDSWRDYCLASVTTHDLPPTRGYLAGDHIALRDRLGRLTRPVEEELAGDRHEKDMWRQLLGDLGLVDWPHAWDDDAVVPALHAFLARTPALLRCAALTDVVGERRTQNQPGTLDEYPNWRIPLGGPDGRVVWLEDIVADERANPVLGAIRE